MLVVKDISDSTFTPASLWLWPGGLMIADMKVKANLILVFAVSVVFAVGSD